MDGKLGFDLLDAATPAPTNDQNPMRPVWPGGPS